MTGFAAGCGDTDEPNVLVERLPDAGSAIAFVHGDAIWTLSADGVVRKLVGGGATSPAWSPDGERIAFVRDDDTCPQKSPSRDIWVVNADGSDEERLTACPKDDSQPAWSPDGHRIVFIRGEAIFVMSADGSGPHAVGPNGSSPAWSPDGRWIAFSSHRGDWDLWLVRPNGTGRRLLTPGPMQGWAPEWSPNAKRIAFVDLTGVWVVKADGSDRARLTTARFASDQGVDLHPDWSPDGRSIVYVRGVLGADSLPEDGLWLVNVEGGKPRQITEGDDSEPSWRPAR